MFAVGGETTGTEIEAAKGVVFELDLDDNQALKQLVESLDDKPVTVLGTLIEKKGIEVPTRKIIKVKELKAAAK